MFENKTGMPRFLIYIMAILALFVFIGMFFSVKIVACIYFVALAICVVLLITNKRYTKLITNYKVTFFLFDTINLFAIISVIYYEYSKHSKMLNIFLILLVIVELALMAVDLFVLQNKKITVGANSSVNFIKLCAMICILTYFFNVSKLFFALDAFMFEIANLFVKLIVSKMKVVEKETDKEQALSDEEFIKMEIQSVDAEEGEIE